MTLVRSARGWLQESRFQVDVLLAGLAWLACIVLEGTSGTVPFVLTTAQVLPLAWRRTQPFLAALVIAAACVLQLMIYVGPMLSNVSVLAITYATAAYARERWQGGAVLGVGLLGAVLGALDWMVGYSPFGGSWLLETLPTVVFMWMSVGVAWVLGDAVRRRRAVLSRLREQNEALARDQAQRSALAAQGERASIAREMHDIVAHSLSVVVVQADGGAYAARLALGRGAAADPDQQALERAAQTLETLAATAREALTDTRRLVGVLRDKDGSVDYAPAQGLADIEDLVQRVRDAGLPVSLAVRGDVASLARDLDLAAYRVVQESLTNVLKHAGGEASVAVDVLRTPAVLLVRVTDDGVSTLLAGTVPDGRGNGIVGMRERVEVLGGTLHAGPRTGGGFEVVASVPVPTAGRDGVFSGDGRSQR